MSDVFEILKADHNEVERMLQLLTGPAEAGDRLVATVERLVMAESRHEAAEEMHFWPAVRQKVQGGDNLADQALAQEAHGKRLLDELRRTAHGQVRFAQLIREFADAGREHMAFEEQEVWPRLARVISEDERPQLGADIEDAEKHGPTRPHPHGPDNPAGLKTVGTAAAALDRARDAITGRGKR